MIGQKQVIEKIDKYVLNGFPKCLVICGNSGSGKKTLLKYISKKLESDIIFFNNNTDGVRDLINTCYTQTKRITYCICDCQDFSKNAENALLKVCEEPPENCFIILLYSNKNILPTIQSRSVVIEMQPYSRKDLEDYCKLKNIDNPLIVKYSNNCGDIDKLIECDFNDICKICNNIIENGNKANICSYLKIGNKLKLKEGKEGYDPEIFLKCLEEKIFESTESIKNKKILAYRLNGIKIIEDTLYKFNFSYSKQNLIDSMLIKLKECLI